MLLTLLKTVVITFTLLSLSACAQSAPATSTKATHLTGATESVKSKDTSYDNLKYRAIIDTLIKRYKKQQSRYDLNNIGSTFHFQVTPITLYPFFCGSVFPAKKAEVIYIYGSSYSAYRIVDDAKYYEIVQVGVENFIQNGFHSPTIKIYRLHSFIYNLTTSQWQEEGTPKETVLELMNSKEEIYGCRTVKR
jgi:hypothetical protein